MDTERMCVREKERWTNGDLKSHTTKWPKKRVKVFGAEIERKKPGRTFYGKIYSIQTYKISYEISERKKKLQTERERDFERVTKNGSIWMHMLTLRFRIVYSKKKRLCLFDVYGLANDLTDSNRQMMPKLFPNRANFFFAHISFRKIENAKALLYDSLWHLCTAKNFYHCIL